MRHEHDCGKAGCKIGPPQPRSDHPKNVAAREKMAAVKAWHEAHGIEHNRSGCR